MGRYTVDVDALHELQTHMQDYLATATEGLSRVEALIADVSADWDGTAAEAYQTRHRRWVAALRDMTESLNEFSAWSAAAGDAYRTVMATNLRMAQG